jgi:hypothetical protein
LPSEEIETVNDDKLNTAYELRMQIGKFDTEISYWSARREEKRPRAHSENYIRDFKAGPMPKSDNAWRVYLETVIAELTLQRDQLKREFEVL